MRKSHDLFLIVGVCLYMIAVVFVASGGAEIDTAHVVGAWLLDENEGDAAIDASGSGNDGRLLKGAKWDAGKFGSALLFDGVDDAVLIPSNAGGQVESRHADYDCSLDTAPRCPRVSGLHDCGKNGHGAVENLLPRILAEPVPDGGLAQWDGW